MKYLSSIAPNTQDHKCYSVRQKNEIASRISSLCGDDHYCENTKRIRDQTRFVSTCLTCAVLRTILLRWRTLRGNRQMLSDSMWRFHLLYARHDDAISNRWIISSIHCVWFVNLKQKHWYPTCLNNYYYFTTKFNITLIVNFIIKQNLYTLLIYIILSISYF